MVYSTLNSSATNTNTFYSHKKNFFDDHTKYDLPSVSQLSQQISAKNLFDWQDDIHQEFNDLSEILETLSVEDNTETFFYFSLYCCLLLENYHASIDQYYQQQMYRQKAENLIKQLNRVTEAKNLQQRQNFTDSLTQTFADTWDDLKLSLLQPSKFSEKVGQINLSRIVLVLSRFSLSQLFHILEDKNVLQQLSILLNREITSAKLIERMSLFSGALNALSVAMFGSRWLRNVAATLYFTFCPTDQARKALPSKLSRLYHQLYQRKGEFLNDTVWTVVNGVTNYQLFGMSAMAAMGITAGFMFFDIGVLIYLKHCEEKAYVKKQQQYQKEIEALLTKLGEESLSPDDKSSILMQLNILEQQKIHNQIHWRQTAAVYHFQIFAAVLLATGFSFSLLVASPYVVIGCYTSCLFAASMYLSSGDYGKLQAIKAKRDNADALSLDTAELDKEYQEAQFNLAFNLVKNTVVPPIIIGTFLLCWEAGLALIVAYIAMEAFNYYQQHKSDNTSEIVDMGMEPCVVI